MTDILREINSTILKRKNLEHAIIEKQQILAQLLDASSKKGASLSEEIKNIFSKDRKNALEEISVLKKEIEQLENELKNCVVQFQEIKDEKRIELYEALCTAFKQLTGSNKIWDISKKVKDGGSSVGAAYTVYREEVVLKINAPEYIYSPYPSLQFDNADGHDFFLFPDFILYTDVHEKLNIIQLEDIEFKHWEQSFREFSEEDIPEDTELIDYVWKKVKEDGSPDMEDPDNRQIPLVKYGAIQLLYQKEFEETYYSSNLIFANNFKDALQNYLFQIKKEKGIITDSKEEANIESDNKDFSLRYFKLLKEYIPYLKKRINNLKSKNIFAEHPEVIVQTGLSESDFFDLCMMHDLLKIMEISTDGHIGTDSLEAFGLVLMVRYLLIEEDQNLSFEYDALKQEYEQKSFKKDAAKLLANKDEFQKNISQFLNHNKFQHSASLIEEQDLLFVPFYLKTIQHEFFNDFATAINRFATIIAKSDNIVTPEETEHLKKIFKLTHNPQNFNLNDYLKFSQNDDENDETLEDVLNEIHELIGLKVVKDEIDTFINYVKVQKARKEQGLKTANISYHIVFTGNPGTGKTIIGRLMAKIYYHLQLLPEGKLVETDRSGLVAEYTGQTAVKTNNTIDTAMNGILFIDEAYALVGENKDDFGKEAVATLIKRMEDDRDKLAIILAGYPNEMNTFIESNPGLQSRFNRYIHFPDYTPQELFEIFELNCRKLEYQLSEKAKEKLMSIIMVTHGEQNKNFGNGRYSRNLFEKTIERQANRIAKEEKLTKEILLMIEKEDIDHL